MKIKVIDRILVAFLAIVVIAASVIGILMAVNLITADTVAFCSSSLYGFWQVQTVVIVVCAILIIISLRLLFMHQKRETAQKDIILRTTEHGVIRISVFTIDSLVQKHAKSVSYVRDVKSKVKVLDSGVKLDVHLSLMPDTNIPETTAQLQQSMKEYVQTYSGILVQEVQIFVDDTSVNLSTRAN